MKLLKTTAAAVAVVAISGVAASAATFDFAADAEAFFNTSDYNGDNYEGTFEQVYGAGGATDDGITVTATASFEGEEATPFMDSRGNNDGDDVAGLGVCRYEANADGISTCSTNVGPNQSDDNLQSPESLELTFSGTGDLFSITDLVIRDAGHDLITGEDVIIINGMSFDADGGNVLGLGALADASVYTFTSSKGSPQIYLSVLDVSEVPVPAAGLLLLGGLGGLAAMKRRKKKAA